MFLLVHLPELSLADPLGERPLPSRTGNPSPEVKRRYTNLIHDREPPKAAEAGGYLEGHAFYASTARLTGPWRRQCGKAS